MDARLRAVLIRHVLPSEKQRGLSTAHVGALAAERDTGGTIAQGRREKEAGMLDNATYNLMETAAQISKGLHRYETFKKDAKECKECAGIWDELRRSDEQQLQHIVNHLKQHFVQDADTKERAA
jgi:hypothetical protein